MKNNVMLGILVTALILSSGATLVLAGVNFIAKRQIETARQRTELIKATLNAAQGLANDSIRYSKENPAIAAVLTNFSSQTRRLRTPPPSSSSDTNENSTDPIDDPGNPQ